MKNTLAFFLLGIIVFSACSKKNSGSSTTSEGYDIFLIAGQSNTHYGLGLDRNIDTPDPDIFQMGRFDTADKVIIPAVEPLQHWTMQSDRIGFALTFAKLYKQNILKSGRKVLLIPCGYAGTPIEQWAKGGDLYNDAVERTLLALANNPGSEIKGILWHQGEVNVSDSVAVMNTYQNNLANLIQDFRNSLGNPELPFVLGGMVPVWVNESSDRRSMQDLFKSTPSRIAKTAYADPESPTVISNFIPDDNIHYNAAGQRELGGRYFTAFKTVL
jgi:hypothetical protein